MFIFTVYALIGDDMRLLAFTKKADTAFLVINILTFSLFMIELTLSSICIKDYFGSFFFWLDLISTISLIADIDPVWEAITSSGSDEETDAA